MTDTARKCPQCGSDLPADAPAGLCPKCLLAAGMAGNSGPSESSSTGAPTTPLPGSAHFVPPTPEALASLFPQLEILELIGAGGMGAVYKARQRGLDRFVAVKILPPEVGADPSFAQRFTREAQSLAKFGHQHIVGIHDFGVAGGLYYFIMEYIDGANLRHLLQTGELQPAQALAIVPQVCEALQFAHDEGVVHRDIKPENILIDKRGRVKIADFGLARMLGKDTPEVNLTATNQVMGTLHYMAPEQLQGLRTVDHRADIYSLGVVFYEMLTGELPLGRFAPPSQKVELDVRLDEIVLRSLENKPERRYQQASEVKTDVERISAESSAPAGDRGIEIPAAAQPVSTDSAAARPAAARSIEHLSTALLILGGLGLFVMLALPLFLVTYATAYLDGPNRPANHGGGGPTIFSVTAWITMLYSMIALPHAVIIFVAGLFLRNGRGYWLAVVACILAALPITLIVPVGLPIGLWGLALLASRDVRAAFARNVIASSKSPAEQLHWPAIMLIVAGAIDIAQALVGAVFVVLSVRFAMQLDDVPMAAIAEIHRGPIVEAFAFGVLALALGLLRTVGGAKMLRLERYGFTSFATVASLLPLSVGSLIGVPAAILALFTLSRSDVKQTFAQGKDRPPSLDSGDLQSDAVSNPQEIPAAIATDREVGNKLVEGDSVIARDENAEERERAAELAENPPAWVWFAIPGLFGLGWLFMGAMWNFRWPGLAVAIAVMAAITYGVVRWQLVYIPKLRAELLRQSPLRRGFALLVGLILFLLAMRLLIGAQTWTWDDFLSGVHQTFDFDPSEKTVRLAVSLAKLQGLPKDAPLAPGGWSGGSYTMRVKGINTLMSGLFGFFFLLFSLLAVVDTRRFRSNWNYASGPSLITAIFCVFMLPAVQVIRIGGAGGTIGTLPAHEFRCDTTGEQVQAAIDRWTNQLGYLKGRVWHIEIVEQRKKMGRIQVGELKQPSQFDRYRMTWPHGVVRPRPPLSISTVSALDPPQTYVRVELPMQKKGSPEETMWKELLNDLEASIRAAEKTENN